REQHGLAAVELAQRPLVARPGRVAITAVGELRAVRVALQVEGRGEGRPGQERRALLGVRQAGVEYARAVPHSRIARAKSSGSNGRRSSSASPVPISLTGTPSSCAMASAMPPFAV